MQAVTTIRWTCAGITTFKRNFKKTSMLTEAVTITIVIRIKILH